MQKFYTASGRLVLHNPTSHKIYRVRYINDTIARPTERDLLFEVDTKSSPSLNSLISSGNLRPYTTTTRSHVSFLDEVSPDILKTMQELETQDTIIL